MSSRSDAPSGLIGRLSQASWVEPFLGALVAVYGILAAYAAYTAGIFGGNMTSQYFVGLTDLSDGNTAYSEANQTFVEDNNIYTELWMQEILIEDEEKLEEVTDALLSNTSEAFSSNYDLETDEFNDEAYLDEIYAESSILFEHSDQAFEAASAWNSLGDNYDYLVLMLALGLGFAAWASLMSPEGLTRYLFAVLATVLLAYSVVYLIGLETTPRPQSYESCYKADDCLGGEFEEEAPEE